MIENMEKRFGNALERFDVSAKRLLIRLELLTLVLMKKNWLGY